MVIGCLTLREEEKGLNPHQHTDLHCTDHILGSHPPPSSSLLGMCQGPDGSELIPTWQVPGSGREQPCEQLSCGATSICRAGCGLKSVETLSGFAIGQSSSGTGQPGGLVPRGCYISTD